MKKIVVAVILAIVLGITHNYSFKANAQMGSGMMGSGGARVPVSDRVSLTRSSSSVIFTFDIQS